MTACGRILRNPGDGSHCLLPRGHEGDCESVPRPGSLIDPPPLKSRALRQCGRPIAAMSPILCVLPERHDGECSIEPRICRAPDQPDAVIATFEAGPRYTPDTLRRALERSDYVRELLPEPAERMAPDVLPSDTAAVLELHAHTDDLARRRRMANVSSVIEIVEKRITIRWDASWPPAGALLVECLVIATGEVCRYPVTLDPRAADLLRELNKAVTSTAREVARLEQS